MLRKSLTAKLIFYIGIVLIITIGFFAFINTNTQKKLRIQEMKQDGVQISEMLEKSFSQDMMTAQKNRIQKTLEDIGNSEVIENIRIFDKTGTIFVSNSSEEIGISVDRTTEACFVCHIEDQPTDILSRADMTRIFKGEKGYRMLGIINPIYNEPRCSNNACHYHPPEQVVLGVMDILFPLDRFDRQMATSQRQTVLYFFFTFLIIAAGMGLLIHMFVKRPIGSLIEGTRKVADGDLDYRIGSFHSDEIGELGKSFDSMTAELKRTSQEIEQWNIKLKDEVKKATQNLKRANQKLQELDSLKSNFMRKMEHGLRSHVGIIQTCLSLAFKEGQSGLSAQQLDLVTTAKRRSAILLDVLDDIVQLSYRQSASAEYFMQPVHITYVLHKVLEAYRVQAQKKDISVDINTPSDSIVTDADPEALEEVFSNLVSNAIKYNKRNGRVSLLAAETKNNIKIDVKDTGMGISDEDLPKIFNEFYRASNAKSTKIEGTGVGLAIVKEIVEAHRGEIKVQSKLEVGSTVTVVLPKIEKENK